MLSGSDFIEFEHRREECRDFDSIVVAGGQHRTGSHSGSDEGSKSSGFPVNHQLFGGSCKDTDGDSLKETVNTFGGGVAHHFNNLLMGIQGNVTLMFIALDEQHPHQQYIRSIEEGIFEGSVQVLKFLDRINAMKDVRVPEDTLRRPTGNTDGEDSGRTLKLFSHHARLQTLADASVDIVTHFSDLFGAMADCKNAMIKGIAPEHPNYIRLKRMEKLVGKGEDIVRRLMFFAGIAAIPKQRPVSLDALLLSIVRDMEQKTGAAGIHLQMEGLLERVSVDPTLFREILMNIQDNASRAMAGKERLHIKAEMIVTADHRGEASGSARCGTVIISLKDSGDGMTAAVRDKIFEPFFTTRDSRSGIGLGLTSAYGAVRMLGGTMGVSSREGQGTTVHVYLPVLEAAAEKKQPAIACRFDARLQHSGSGYRRAGL